MHFNSCVCLHWADLLCETKPDCFSLLSSIVSFKYVNQYRQLAPTNQSIPTIPQGAEFQTFTLWKMTEVERIHWLCAGGHKHTGPQFQHTDTQLMGMKWKTLPSSGNNQEPQHSHFSSISSTLNFFVVSKMFQAKQSSEYLLKLTKTI